MRPLAIALVVVALYSSIAWAQQPAAPGMVGGVKFGLNIANLSENTETVDSKTGLVFGGYVGGTWKAVWRFSPNSSTASKAVLRGTLP